jgi:hypothetical protein
MRNGLPLERRTFIGNEKDQADHLEGARIRSSKDWRALLRRRSTKDSIPPEEQIRAWIRRMSILVVTDGAD